MTTRLTKLTAAMLAASLFSGCASTTAYTPRVGEHPQTLTYAQGVGTLATRTDLDEIVMYPTFKTQDSTTYPTFTIAYANNRDVPVNFTTGNVKAFFRGQPVPIYTYTDRVAEIKSVKQNKQIALAILGGLAAASAAHAASRQTYTSNYSGAVWNRFGATNFSSLSTTTVYNPMAGIVAGGAMAGVTGLGIRQIEHNAESEELAANGILQENTVHPQQVVKGEVILKECCDRSAQSNDVLRFEVTVGGKTTAFMFDRSVITK